jgi:hypothetical protein
VSLVDRDRHSDNVWFATGVQSIAKHLGCDKHDYVTPRGGGGFVHAMHLHAEELLPHDCGTVSANCYSRKCPVLKCLRELTGNLATAQASSRTQ